MDKNKFNFSKLLMSKFAGILYLLIAFIGAFSIMYVPETLIAKGDAALTVSNISANLTLFRLGMIGDLFVVLAEIILSVLLYVLFSGINKTANLVALTSRVAMAIVMSINLLVSIFVLHILRLPEYLNSFSSEQISSMVMLLLDLHGYGIFVWQFFFFLHCFAIGYLIYRSGFIPKLIGLFLWVGSLGYLLDALRNSVFVGVEYLGVISSLFLLVVVLGEFWLAGWLLFKGIKD